MVAHRTLSRTVVCASKRAGMSYADWSQSVGGSGERSQIARLVTGRLTLLARRFLPFPQCWERMPPMQTPITVTAVRSAPGCFLSKKRGWRGPEEQNLPLHSMSNMMEPNTPLCGSYCRPKGLRYWQPSRRPGNGLGPRWTQTRFDLREVSSFSLVVGRREE